MKKCLHAMNTRVRAHPLILSGDKWVGYVRSRKKGELEVYPSSDFVGDRLRSTTLDELVRKDETLAQLQSLPPMTQAWRWDPGTEFSQRRLPVGPTYFFCCEAKPDPEHPQRERVGAAVVNGWVRAESKAKARTIFEQELEGLHLIPEHLKEPEMHRLEDYEEDAAGREYFEQAQLDGEVVVCHLCPRYPVYWVTAAVERGSSAEVAEVHYFLCADSIRQEGEDLYDPDFWTGERERTALKAALAAIREAGWTVTSYLEKRPCGRDDVPEQLVAYYDEAEESNACLVFIHEGGAQED